MVERTTVLLGAGASVDAGVPVSTQLTRAIAEAVDIVGRPWRNQTAMALNVAIGAIVAHDTARGVGAYDGIDVERLFSAVEMLADRDGVEIAPFVASWNPALTGLGAPKEVPSFWGKKFQKELLDANFSTGIERVFAEGVRAVAGAGDSDSVYRQLGKQMVSALRDCLAIESGASDYLAPLASGGPSPVRVATLNYDRGVELMGESTGKLVSTGLPEWGGGSLEWSFDPAAEVHLLKLHGSIDWVEVVVRDGPRVIGEERFQRLAERRFEHRDDSDESGGSIGDLGVVFGQRGKLRSEGPFLAMLTEFERWLTQTDRLVVIGYSFRDDHINSLIRRWYNSEPSGGLTIVDPAVGDMVPTYRPGQSGFRQDLARAMHRAVSTGYELIEPHALLPEGARTGIARLFGS